MEVGQKVHSRFKTLWVASWTLVVLYWGPAQANFIPLPALPWFARECPWVPENTEDVWPPGRRVWKSVEEEFFSWMTMGLGLLLCMLQGMGYCMFSDIQPSVMWLKTTQTSIKNHMRNGTLIQKTVVMTWRKMKNPGQQASQCCRRASTGIHCIRSAFPPLPKQLGRHNNKELSEKAAGGNWVHQHIGGIGIPGWGKADRRLVWWPADVCMYVCFI